MEHSGNSLPPAGGPPPWRSAVAALRQFQRYKPGLRDLRGPGYAAISFAAAFAGAMLWLLFGPYVVFPPTGFMDSWFYPGYFSNFSYLWTLRGLTYYVSRLPWILPGRLIYALAGPLAGSLLLASGMIAVGAASVYWMVRWQYGRAAGLLAAVTVATNPFLVASSVWQYPDGPAIAYALAAMAMYLRPNGSRSVSDFWAAGLLVMAAGTNLAVVPVILSILLIPLWRCRANWRELLKEATASLAGAAAVAAVLGALAHRLLGITNFLFPQIQQIFFAMDVPGYLETMWGKGNGFLFTAIRYFVPAFLLILTPVLLWTVRRPAPGAWSVYLALLAACGLYALQEFVLHGAALRVVYHSSFLLAPELGLTGILVGEAWRYAASRGKAGGGTIALLVGWSFAVCMFYCYWRPKVTTGGAWTLLAVLGAVCLIAIFVSGRGWPRAAHLSSGVLIAVVFLGPALDATCVQWIFAAPGIVHTNYTTGRNADSFRTVLALQQELKPQLAPGRSIIFWWDSDEPDASLYISSGAIFVSGMPQASRALAEDSMEQMRGLFPVGRTLVHLTSHPERIAERTLAMEAHGIRLEHQRGFQMRCPDGTITVVLQDIADVTAMH